MSRFSTVLRGAILCAFMAFGTGCASAEGGESLGDAASVFFAPDASEAAAIANPMLGLTGPYWLPSREDAQSLQRALRDHLAAAEANEKKRILGALDDYRFQYFGVTRDGERRLLANAFCSRHWKRDSRWETEPVFVLDGGNCYFQVEMDQESGRLLSFNVNGEA